MLKSLLPTCALAALALCGCSSVHKIEPTPVRVAVAESLRPAMLDIAKAYEQTQPFVRLEIISGNALSLQRQMLKKIPADLAILDGPGLMDELIEKDVVVGKSRVSLLTNRLIIVTGAGAPATESFIDFVEKSDKKIAVGDFEQTVVGQYTQEAFSNMTGLLEKLQGRMLTCKSSEAVAAAVLGQQAQVGVVYVSTAKNANELSVLGQLPRGVYRAPTYDAGVLRAAPHYSAAWELLTYLRGKQATDIFIRHSLTPVVDLDKLPAAR